MTGQSKTSTSHSLQLSLGSILPGHTANSVPVVHNRSATSQRDDPPRLSGSRVELLNPPNGSQTQITRRRLRGIVPRGLIKALRNDIGPPVPPKDYPPRTFTPQSELNFPMSLHLNGNKYDNTNSPFSGLANKSSSTVRTEYLNENLDHLTSPEAYSIDTGSPISTPNHSTSSAKHSLASKNSFRNLVAHNMKHLQDPMFSGRRAYGPLDPAKFSPPPSNGPSTGPSTASTENYPDPRLRYASVINGNPFSDEERETKWADLEPRSDIQNSSRFPFSTNKAAQKKGGMSQSHSENDILAARRPSPIDTSQLYSKDNAIAYRANQPPARRSDSPVRGRSPVKYLEELKEGEVIPMSPSRRSKSPMKKLLFGEGGWLGRSMSMKDLDEPSEQYRKTGLKHWGGKLKQRVEDLTEDVTKIIPSSFHTVDGKEHNHEIISKFPVSLDPPTQAKLYMEIELMICVTANSYLMQQRRERRMSVESLIKITEFWKSKGRPQVIEFQFDQATQRDLILYNLKTFRFYGRNAENNMQLHSMLHSWKAIAKEMTIRTFCYPDAVIRRHMHDIYRIMELLGAPLVTFLAFQEIQVRALKVMREEHLKREEKVNLNYGVEKPWYPPSMQSNEPRKSKGSKSPDRKKIPFDALDSGDMNSELGVDCV